MGFVFNFSIFYVRWWDRVKQSSVQKNKIFAIINAVRSTKYLKIIEFYKQKINNRKAKQFWTFAWDKKMKE